MSDGCNECDATDTVAHYPFCEDCYDRLYQEWVDMNGGHIPQGNEHGEI